MLMAMHSVMCLEPLCWLASSRRPWVRSAAETAMLYGALLMKCY